MPKLIRDGDDPPKPSFKDHLGDLKKIRVEVPFELLSQTKMWQQLDEATRATVGRYTAFRHQPHFQGDDTHGHCEVGGGYEIAWCRTPPYPRKHPGKFPANIPRDARAAVAKVLDVDPDLLEGFRIHDAEIDEDVLLIDIKDTSKGSQGACLSTTQSNE